MSDKSNEQISNLMDGELEINASKFLLKRMASDESLSKTWDNYHLIKSCMQKQATEPVIDIASRVTQQLKNESIGISKHTTELKKPLIHRWLKPIMGLGIAASVAFLSVTMLQKQQIKSIDSPVVENAIAKIDISNPILQTNINATTAASDKTLMPPPSLSRFPSLSTQQNSYGQGQYNNQTPYIIIINNSVASKNINQLSPIRNKGISD